MDEKIDGINCAQLKKEGKCDPINHADAIFCQKTCGICGSEV